MDYFTDKRSGTPVRLIRDLFLCGEGRAHAVTHCTPCGAVSAGVSYEVFYRNGIGVAVRYDLTTSSPERPKVFIRYLSSRLKGRPSVLQMVL